MMDLDYFKEYNDNYGHLKGDICLTAVAKIIKESIPEAEYDVKCHFVRYGGEEFLILAENYNSDEILALAEKIRKNVEDAKIEHSYSKNSNYLTLSAGCSTGIFNAVAELENLVSGADRALYEAKKSGRNVVKRS
jgi:diguanylate cyclase (GGDEF)-like protein